VKAVLFTAFEASLCRDIVISGYMYFVGYMQCMILLVSCW
jgi:hypothetical protein